VQDPLTAELAYRETLATRERVHAVRRAATVPMRFIAAVFLGGAIAVLVVGQYHLLLYYAPAYAIAFTASAWSYRRYASAHGLLLPLRPWVLILTATLMGSAAASHAGLTQGNQNLSDFGPFLVFAVGLLVTAWWLRSRRLALTALAMTATTGVVAVFASKDVAVALQAAAYGILLWRASTPGAQERRVN
jgi:hypothetical protein